MMTSLHAFPDEAMQAQRLADATGLNLSLVDPHTFPDGESLPRVPTPSHIAIVYRSLDRPNGKLVELLLAADAWRRTGAQRLVLVAPYLPYMRQDKVFRKGEPISQRVVASLLDGAFDRIVTVDPHLHRTESLGDIFQLADCTHVRASDALVPFLRSEQVRTGKLVIVGPDAESAPWVRGIAEPLSLESLVLRKQRRSDREVDISAPTGFVGTGKNALLVDDICSTGTTLCRAARAIRSAGCASVSVYVTHALCNQEDLGSLQEAGVDRVISSDSCTHVTNAVHLAPLLAAALSKES
jgi:ribose-phosphate pyrophosphokinase